MTEIGLREDMGCVKVVDNPHSVSWLSFTFVQIEDYSAVPVSTRELEAAKNDRIQEGDFFIAGVNLLAESVADVRTNIKRYVNSIGDI